METEKMTMAKFIKNIRQNVVSSNLIPMQLNVGWPVLSIRDKNLCVCIPFFRSVLNTGDNTLIYPITYTITATWNKGTVVEFKNLRFDSTFQRVDFSKPVGKFRHDAVKHLNGLQYKEKRQRLFELYDKLIDCIYQDVPFEGEDKTEFKQILQMLMEPSLKPFYKALGAKFYNSFIEENE